MSQMEIFFDCSSPWTYLAISRLGDVARQAGVTPEWKPILVGGIFNQVNEQVYENRANPNPRKAKYSRKDMADWARYQGVEINWPSIFPVNSVKGMRACIAAGEQGKVEEFALALCDAYWGRDQDIAQVDVICAVSDQVGADTDRIVERMGQQDVKDQLRDNTQAVIDRGGFGSPTIFLNKTDMYFGNDRMPLIAAALGLSTSL